MNSAIWILSWLFIILGVIMVIAGNISSTYDKSKEPYKGHTIGTVVDLVVGVPDKTGLKSGVHNYFYPVIAYYAQGQFFKERYRRGGNPCPFTINQKLSLYYDTKKPEKFKIVQPTRLYYISKMCYFTGLAFCLAGGLAFLMYAMRIF